MSLRSHEARGPLAATHRGVERARPRRWPVAIRILAVDADDDVTRSHDAAESGIVHSGHGEPVLDHSHVDGHDGIAGHRPADR